MVPGTAFLHACRYLDSRGAPTPHLRTPHAGAARTHPHPACTQKVPGNKVFRIWQAGALDSGNKIAASAHGMGSGGLAVDAMAIGCLGVERRVERFFSYLAIFLFHEACQNNQFHVNCFVCVKVSVTQYGEN